MPEILFAGGVILLVAMAAGASAWASRSHAYAGFQEWTTELEGLSGALRRPRHRRTRSGLEISGSFAERPVTIRLSTARTGAPIEIEMRGRVPITMAASRAATAMEGAGKRVQTSDPFFNGRFLIRSSSPFEAAMLCDQFEARRSVAALCCAERTLLTIVPGRVTLAEPRVPGNLGEHLIRHLQSMAALLKAAEELPGADQVRVGTGAEGGLATRPRVAIAVALLVGLLLAAATYEGEGATLPRPATATADNGIDPMDANVITRSREWRVAGSKDMDPAFLALAERNRAAFSGKQVIHWETAGGERSAVLYTLVSPAGAIRVVLVDGQQTLIDRTGAELLGALTIPQPLVNAIEWSPEGAPQARSEADGVFLLLRHGDQLSAQVVFPSQGQTFVGIPANLQSVALR